MNLSDVSTNQLRRAVQIKEQIDSLQTELDALLTGSSGARRGRPPGRTTVISASRSSGRRTMSPAARARIAAAQRARWAKQKGKSTKAKPRRKMSAAGRARIIAATKARWARWKKEQGK